MPRSSRREFSKAVKVEIVKRATRDSAVYCEACGVQAKVWHIDHTIPDGLQIDKSKPLTAADGKLLCAGSLDTCHGRKTALQDVPAIAKAKRNEAKHLRVVDAPAKLQGAPFARSRKAAARAERGPKQSLQPRALFAEDR